MDCKLAIPSSHPHCTDLCICVICTATHHTAPSVPQGDVLGIIMRRHDELCGLLVGELSKIKGNASTADAQLTVLANWVDDQVSCHPGMLSAIKLQVCEPALVCCILLASPRTGHVQPLCASLDSKAFQPRCSGVEGIASGLGIIAAFLGEGCYK
jgi:hypothetical protein